MDLNLSVKPGKVLLCYNKRRCGYYRPEGPARWFKPGEIPSPNSDGPCKYEFKLRCSENELKSVCLHTTHDNQNIRIYEERYGGIRYV